MAEKPKEQPQAVALRKDAAAYLASPHIVGEVAKVLPAYITGDRFMRIVQTTVMSNWKLQQAASHADGKLSLMDAILRCAQAGLEPDGRLAHFVPFWNKDKKTHEVKVIFDFKGLIAAGKQGSGFDNVYADMVCENDQFRAWVENGEKKLLHEIDYKKPRGDAYAFYCVTMKKGIMDYEIMTYDETEEIRKRSRAADEGPWVSDPAEMRKKCPIRRMAKRWELRCNLWADDDTPPPLQKSEERPPASPLFNVKSEVTVAPPETPASADSKELDELVKSVEKKAAESKIEVKILAGFLFDMGVTETMLGSIREFPIDVLRMVDAQWQDMVTRINGGEQ